MKIIDEKHILIVLCIIEIILFIDIIIIINGFNLNLTDNEKISVALNNTDDKILKVIGDIKILPTRQELYKVCKNTSLGCVKITFKDKDVYNAKIYMLASEEYSIITCQSFQDTIYHEIGHVDFALNNGDDYNATLKKISDNYANNYASNFTNSNLCW